MKGRFFMKQTDHPQLKLAMVLKAHQLSKNSDSNISVKDVRACVERKWSKQSPRRFYEAIFDVFETTLDQVVQSMIRDSMSQAIRAPLSEYDDLIGGSK